MECKDRTSMGARYPYSSSLRGGKGGPVKGVGLLK